jgi:hypothetical protein
MTSRNQLLLVLTLCSHALAGKADKDSAQRAHEQGNFAKAFREWQSFAKKGDTESHFRLGVM